MYPLLHNTYQHIIVVTETQTDCDDMIEYIRKSEPEYLNKITIFTSNKELNVQGKKVIYADLSSESKGRDCAAKFQQQFVCCLLSGKHGFRWQHVRRVKNLEPIDEVADSVNDTDTGYGADRFSFSWSYRIQRQSLDLSSVLPRFQ